MLKYLVIALILVLLFYSPLLRSLRGRPRQGTPPPAPDQPGHKPHQAESMLPCAHCGVHLPSGDALKDEQGRAYCSAAHRQAGPARG